MRLSIAAAVLLTAAVLGPPGPVLAASPEKENLETERLRLDIDRLERENGSTAQVQKWLPLGSVAVAVAGGLFAAFRYRGDLKRERKLRIEEGIARNLERIVDRPADGAHVNARVVAALKNLDGFAPDSETGRRKRVTETVTAIVRDDLSSLTTPDTARLPVLCVDSWKPFEQRVRSDSKLCQRVLGRYRVGLERIASTGVQYVSALRVSDDGGFESDKGQLDEPTRLLLEALIAGYVRYTLLLTDASQRSAAVERLKTALNNPKLAESLFPAGHAQSGGQ